MEQIGTIIYDNQYTYNIILDVNLQSPDDDVLKVHQISIF